MSGFDRYTDRARKVLGLARQEAVRLNHQYLGTEHILLGLVEEGSGVAANVLRNLGADLDQVRREVEKIVKEGPTMAGATAVYLQFTPRVVVVLEKAFEESTNLRHNYIGTEHLLLGLLREGEGVAAQVLVNLGLKPEEVREETLELLGVQQSQPKADDRVVVAAGNGREFRLSVFGPLLTISGYQFSRNKMIAQLNKAQVSEMITALQKCADEMTRLPKLELTDEERRTLVEIVKGSTLISTGEISVWRTRLLGGQT